MKSQHEPTVRFFHMFSIPILKFSLVYTVSLPLYCQCDCRAGHVLNSKYYPDKCAKVIKLQNIEENKMNVPRIGPTDDFALTLSLKRNSS